jgi:hypothetical protein
MWMTMKQWANVSSSIIFAFEFIHFSFYINPTNGLHNDLTQRKEVFFSLFDGKKFMFTTSFTVNTVLELLDGE